jgi:hypothetical protein
MKCVMPKFLPLAPVRHPFTALARLYLPESSHVDVHRRSWR